MAAAGGVALLLILFAVLAPVAATNVVKGSYHAMPKFFRDAIPDSAENGVGDALDDYVRTVAGGRADVLIKLDLELENASVDVGGWTGTGDVRLAWTDLGHQDIEYDVYVVADRDATLGSPATTTSAPNATVQLPSEGQWYVVVVARAGSETGDASTFGPFGYDPSAPQAPVLTDRPDPPGYTFDLSWSAVTDRSGVQGYEVSRATGKAAFEPVAAVGGTSYTESNLGNGEYTYRVRAVNGAGVASAWSNEVTLRVEAAMENPGVGAWQVGIHANFTSFLKLWDLDDPDRYLDLSDLDESPHNAARAQYTGPEWGIETGDQTLRQIVDDVVGDETNTMLIAKDLFIWLYEQTDYNTNKAAGPNQDLQTATETLELGHGICGDLAVLYITVLRIAGVPARPVHGYLDNNVTGGEFHMWVEAYVGGDVDYPWMTIDVSGASWEKTSSQPVENAVYIYFGVFNPDYLSLGTEIVYDEPEAQKASWNAWARFSWTCSGSECQPGRDAGGLTQNVEVVEKWLLIDEQAGRRAALEKEPGASQPTIPDDWDCSGGNCFFVTVHDRVVKRIDYGVTITDVPSNLNEMNIELRFPRTDVYSAMNPWQSVIYQVYDDGQPITKADGSDVDGFLEFSKTY